MRNGVFKTTIAGVFLFALCLSAVAEKLEAQGDVSAICKETTQSQISSRDRMPLSTSVQTLKRNALV